VERAGLLDRILCSEPSSAYHIRYTVNANKTGPVRVPLAVPEIPTTGAAGVVNIAFRPNSQDMIVGDTFPTFQRHPSGEFTAELSNVPSHIELAIWQTGQPRLQEHWLTPVTLSDVVVVALLVLGSAIRAMMRRKGRSLGCKPFLDLVGIFTASLLMLHCGRDCIFCLCVT
jgi:hypothetical protein